MINVFQPTVGNDELAAIRYAFESNWLGRGPMCEILEESLAGYWGVDAGSVLLFNSCTSAIYVMMRALGIGPGDEVILPTIHFVGAMNAVIDCGATPVLADVDARTLMLEPDAIAHLWNEKTRAVFVLQYGGNAYNYSGLEDLYFPGSYLLEDVACAPASMYGNRSAGTLADAAVWSFDAMKIMTMGDGGALWLNDPGILNFARELRSLGMKAGEQSGLSRRRRDGADWWEYEVTTSSGRFVSNDIAAAIGIEQLDKLPGFVGRRREIWSLYDKALEDLVGTGALALPPLPGDACTSSYCFYWIQTEHRDKLACYLFDRDIYTTFRYWPLHRAFKCGDDADFPGAAEAADTTLLLPCHQGLSDEDIANVCEAVKEFFA